MIPAACGMNETKLEVTEDYEEAELSDVDDDVFIRGRSSGFRLELYDTAKKPLMAPRKKHKDLEKLKNGGFHTEVRSSVPSLRLLCVPLCYILIATVAMLGIIALVAVLSHYVPIPSTLLKFWGRSTGRRNGNGGLLPCDTFKVEDVWVRTFPKLLTESAFRLLDVNGDGVDDIVFGFPTGADGYEIPEIVCDIYFAGQKPCFGGVVALNGRDGSELWRHWTSHEVFALNCNEDVSGDGVKDCLLAGRGAVFGAVSGKEGRLLWTFGDSPAKHALMNVYTPQFIRDVNEDGVPDILAIHGGDPLADPGSKKRLSGRILLLSGKDGELLRWTETPDKAETYYSPQVLAGRDGEETLLLGTGGETHAGGLYAIPLHDITDGHTKNARLIYHDSRKGLISTPVLTDVNADGIEDIVIPIFNSTVIAFDGTSYAQIWNFSFPSSETYTTPTPGFFNEDNVPDFLVKYQTGPGFPIYTYAQTTILDGRSGEPFLDMPLLETIGSQASTPLIRVQGYGNDIFLFWTSDCVGVTGNASDFTFQKESRREAEEAGAVNTSLQGKRYLENHPDLRWREGGEQLPSTKIRTTALYGKESSGQAHPIDGLNYGMRYGANDFSEAEVPQSLPYPSFHAVRKHGRVSFPPSPSEVNDNSRVQSTDDLEQPLWSNYDEALFPPQDDLSQTGEERLRWEGSLGRRVRRHIGPHDGDGIQRLISTGNYFGMDHDQYEDTVTKDCVVTEEGAEGGVFESQATYDPFDVHMGQMSVYRLHISCSCAAEFFPGQKGRCGRILPLEEQPWSGYMGSFADSHFTTTKTKNK